MLSALRPGAVPDRAHLEPGPREQPPVVGLGAVVSLEQHEHEQVDHPASPGTGSVSSSGSSCSSDDAAGPPVGIASRTRRRISSARSSVQLCSTRAST